MLQAEGAVSIYAVSGMGGLGKTELALQYAKQHLQLQSYPGGVCWIRARQEIAPQITTFVRSSLNRQVPLDIEIQEQVKWCWQHWDAGDVLIILDDVQDYRDVEPLLPHHQPRFKVLMTTRLRLGWGKREIELQVLSEAKALELLGEIVTDGRIEEQIEDAKALCRWLGYLPLGLELAARYLVRKQDLSLATLRQRLEDQTLDAKALVKPEDQMTAKLGVAAAFELSWNLLDEQAKQLAGLLSVFAAAPMRWDWVQACLPEWDEETLEDARDYQLLGLNLIDRIEAGVYQLHPLIREFFGMKRSQVLDLNAAQEAFYSVVIDEADKAINKPEQSLLKETNAVLPHLKEASKQFETAGNEETLASCLAWLAYLYYFQGRYAEAEPLYVQVLEIHERQLGADHPDVAMSLNNLANLYYFQGRYGEAELLYVQALEIRQRQLGADHPHVATSLNNLARLYESQGCYAEAEPLYVQALEIRQRQLGSDHPHVATGLNDLAGLYESQGCYAEAEPLYVQALKIVQRQLGTDHPGVATSLNNLANLYRLQGRYGEAESRFVQALEIHERQLGADHPDVAMSLNNLANLYYFQGRYGEAEPRFVQALKIFQRQLGSDHPDVAMSLNNLAGLYYFQGRYGEAEPRFVQALEIFQRQLGADHPHIATSLNNLAGLYYFQGRYGEAEPLYVQALEIRQRQLGADHPSVATSLNNLAGLYESQGRYAEAEPRYVQALHILLKRLGENHPSTQTVRQNFLLFLQQVIQEKQTNELSDHPMTRSLLQQLQNQES